MNDVVGLMHCIYIIVLLITFFHSGGPLMLSINGSIYQIGIISYGPPCDGRIFPEVLTSISYYMNWIKSHLEL